MTDRVPSEVIPDPDHRSGQRQYRNMSLALLRKMAALTENVSCVWYSLFFALNILFMICTYKQ